MNVFIGLVGSNPLPVFVTLSYLFSEKKTDKESLPVPDKILLVYSKETKKFKENIVSLLGCEDLIEEVYLREKEYSISVRNFLEIKKAIEGKLSDIGKVEKISSIHLNYSGGTKTMGVASFDTVSAFCDKEYIEVFFSDLDPDYFRLNVIKYKEFIFNAIDFGKDLRDITKLSIRELYELHNLRLKEKLKTEVSQLYKEIFNNREDSVRVLVEDFSVEMQNIKNEELYGKEFLKKTEENKTYEACTEERTEEGFKSKDDLKKRKDDLFNKFLSKCLCKEKCCYSTLGRSKKETAYKLLEGEWLEQRVFEVLCDLKKECSLDEITWNVVAQKNDKKDHYFEVDVIALRGYQPFIFSCTTSSKKSLIKQKSFEANYRSVQLGGEHAKTTIVCLGNDDTCNLVKEDMEQFNAARNFSIIGKNTVMDRESLKNKIREIIRD